MRAEARAPAKGQARPHLAAGKQLVNCGALGERLQSNQPANGPPQESANNPCLTPILFHEAERLGPPPYAGGYGRLRQIGRAHQVTVAFPGRAAAFVEGPDHQALAAAAVAGGEHAFDVRRVLLVLGFDVGAGVALHAELLQQRLFGPEETHRQQDQLRGRTCFGAGNFLGHEPALLVSLPSISTVMHFLDAGLVVADELLAVVRYTRGSAPNRGGRLFLAVIQAVDLRPFGPGIVGGALHAGGRGRISTWTRLRQPWRMEVPTQSVPVSPPPMTITSLSSAEM